MLTQVSHWRAALLSLLFVCAATAIRRAGASRPAAHGQPGRQASCARWSLAVSSRRRHEVGDPQFADSDWRWLSANRTWARQGYFKYTGYAWYRLHVQFQSEGVQLANVALLMARVDDAYELYWNGVLVARNGKFPPNPRWPEFGQPPQIIGLGPVHQGVLALRVWKAPLAFRRLGPEGRIRSYRRWLERRMQSPCRKVLLDYHWLRSRQLFFGH